MAAEIIQIAVIVSLLISASVLDMRYREIPDWISGAVALTIVLNFNTRNLWGLLAAAIVFAVALVTGKIGGGDVKLISALSIVCGLWSSLVLLFIAQLSMLVFYGIMVIVKKLQHGTMERALPFVPFLSFGYILAVVIF